MIHLMNNKIIIKTHLKLINNNNNDILFIENIWKVVVTYYNERKYLKDGDDVSALIPGPFQDDHDASILIGAFGYDAAELIRPVYNV